MNGMDMVNDTMRVVSEVLYPKYLQSRKVVTDSRQVDDGCLFFAFKGENVDGNAFATQAVEQGATLSVVDDVRLEGMKGCVVVPDVLQVLQALALYHRQHLDIPVIGITGTNGKTTTKELVNAVLARRYRTHATKNNYNNHLGVPLTLLSMPADTEVAIVEMGANHPGEIDALCRIARPNYGLITNVGRAHLQGFGSFEGVVQTKTEMYRALAAVHGTIFVNADNEILMQRATEVAQMTSVESLLPGIIETGDMLVSLDSAEVAASVVTYGRQSDADVKGSFVGTNPYMKFYFEDGDDVYTVQSRLLGAYNFDNAMAAVCVGRHFGVDLFDIKEAIEQYEPSNNRSQLVETSRNRIIMDCYNANPSSMQAAIESFSQLPYERKVAMMGEMRELGKDSTSAHRDVVKMLNAIDVEQIVLVGEAFRTLANESTKETLWFADVDAAYQHFTRHVLSGATVLLKGSNATKMWKLREVL